jgi:ribonuclease PH
MLTGSGKIVEIQGTAEEDPFTTEEFQSLLNLAQSGCADLIQMQQAALDALTAKA